MGEMRTGFSKAMKILGESNQNVVVLCADLKDSLKVLEFSKKYPQRFVECGICEQNMMGMAAGMTFIGKIPFVLSYSAFNPGRNWDQLRVSVCYSNANVKIIGGHSGLTTGPDGATHQMLEDIALSRVLPNLIVLSPCDEEETRKATLAMAKHRGPVYMRISREKSLDITNEKDRFDIGKANLIYDGSDLVIFATGLVLRFAIEAREELEREGFKIAVVNFHTIKPLDEKMIVKMARKCRAVISVEEHQIYAGFGSAISEILSRKIPTPMEFIGMPDCFGESGEGYELLEKYKISKKEIIKKARKLISEKKNG